MFDARTMKHRTTTRPLPHPLGKDSTPMDVALCKALDFDRRRQLLREWREDEEALERAQGEGMDGGRESRLGELGDAVEALNRLEAEQHSTKGE